MNQSDRSNWPQSIACAAITVILSTAGAAAAPSQTKEDARCRSLIEKYQHMNRIIRSGQEMSTDSAREMLYEIVPKIAASASKPTIDLLDTLGRRAKELGSVQFALEIQRIQNPESVLAAELELRSILMPGCEGHFSEGDQQGQKISPIIPIVIGIGACGAQIAACVADANQVLSACLDQDCGPLNPADSQCCGIIFESDVLSCYITCGVNGPEPIFEYCCPPLPPPNSSDS